MRTTVNDAIATNPDMPAVLIRLHFHDCFVEGCDGSILVDNGEISEKNAIPHQGVGGFEVVDTAKAKLEETCPGVVSCVDIVALAARDAVALAKGPAYKIPTGRRDGLVSNLSLTDNMPKVTNSIAQLKAKYVDKGLSDKDLVVLTGAHSIGTTACFFMTKRLYDFKLGVPTDPSINPEFMKVLTTTCPSGGDVNVRLDLDARSGKKFDKHILDNRRHGFAVLESDAKLNDNESTKSIRNSYFDPTSPQPFEADFFASIVKMGQIGVKTGSLGEIRHTCSSFNK